MSRKYKVDELLAELTAEEVQEYKAILRQPAATIDDLLEWFAAPGRDCKISRGAVWKHRRNYQDLLDGVRRSAEMARAFADVARSGGVEALGEASLARFQQLMTEKLLQMDADEQLDAKELRQLSMAMNAAANTRQRIEAVKLDYEKRQAEALSKAEKLAGSGATGSHVVETIKRALGIAPGTPGTPGMTGGEA